MRIHLAVLASAACGTSKPATVYPADTSTFEMTVTGGDPPLAGPGSTCQPTNAMYTYVLATRALSWTECASPNNDQVYTFVNGAITMSTAQDAQLVGALHALQEMNLGPNVGCASNVHLTFLFNEPDKTTAYADAICLVGESDVENAVYSAAQ